MPNVVFKKANQQQFAEWKTASTLKSYSTPFWEPNHKIEMTQTTPCSIHGRLKATPKQLATTEM